MGKTSISTAPLSDVPVMLLVHSPVHKRDVQEDVIVVGRHFQPKEDDDEREKEVRVAKLVDSEVDGTVVPVRNPAHEKTGARTG